MLRDILALLKERKSQSLTELALHFRVSESTIEAMLNILQQKNRVSKIELDCGSCRGACSACAFKNQPAVYTLNESKTNKSNIEKEEKP